MNTLKYKGYVSKINYDPDDEIFFGKILGIKGIISFHSETAKGLKPAFQEAVEHYLELCEMRKVTPQKAFQETLLFAFHQKFMKKLH